MPKRRIGFTRNDHLVRCDRSGFVYRMSECVVEPKTGFVVHRSEVDMPHPQQYRTPVKPDKQAVTPVRPRQVPRQASVGELPTSITAYNLIYANTDPTLEQGNFPDGTASGLPEVDGEIDDAVTNTQFLNTNDVDPTTF